MAESRQINKTLDLALRVGEMLLSSGAGAADVNATIWSVVHACGLRGVEVDVTFTALTHDLARRRTTSRRSSRSGTSGTARSTTRT